MFFKAELTDGLIGARETLSNGKLHLFLLVNISLNEKGVFLTYKNIPN